MNEKYKDILCLVKEMAEKSVDIGQKGIELCDLGEELESILKDNEHLELMYGEDAVKPLYNMIETLKQMRPIYTDMTMMQFPDGIIN